jgi:hypothetical protein
VQAYAYRVCLTDRPANRLPLEPPDGYDPAEFELLRRYLHSTDVEARDLLGLVPYLLPNGKCDVNSIGPFSLNVLDGSNRDYPDGSDETRERIRTEHLRYTQAFLYFLAHDDSVPSRVRDELRRWGPCADEFAETGGWPHQLYVREGRRLRGAYVLRESDLLDARPQDDVVGSARTTSTCARSSARGATCPSSSAGRPSSTRATCRSPCRRTRSRTAR